MTKAPDLNRADQEQQRHLPQEPVPLHLPKGAPPSRTPLGEIITRIGYNDIEPFGHEHVSSMAARK